MTLSSLLSDWYYPAAIVLLDGCRREDAHGRIRKYLPVSSEEVDSIIAVLSREKLLNEDRGIWRLDVSHQIFKDKSLMNRHYKKFLAQQLDLSRSMLEKNYEKGAKFFSHTFTLNKSDFDIYENKIRKLLGEITAFSDKTLGSEVAQLNVQLFLLPERR